jgi:hypothetical protein
LRAFGGDRVAAKDFRVSRGWPLLRTAFWGYSPPVRDRNLMIILELAFPFLSPATYPSILNTRWLPEWPRFRSIAAEAKDVTNTRGMS